MSRREPMEMISCDDGIQGTVMLPSPASNQWKRSQHFAQIMTPIAHLSFNVEESRPLKIVVPKGIPDNINNPLLLLCPRLE